MSFGLFGLMRPNHPSRQRISRFPRRRLRAPGGRLQILRDFNFVQCRPGNRDRGASHQPAAFQYCGGPIRAFDRGGDALPFHPVICLDGDGFGGWSDATLQVGLVFGNGGWQTNFTTVLGFESDPIYTNNVATTPLDVLLPQTNGVYQVSFPAQDLLYDPVRDRLLISVSASLSGLPSNCIALFNPYSAQEEAATPLPSDPGRMAVSDNGHTSMCLCPTWQWWSN